MQQRKILALLEEAKSYKKKLTSTQDQPARDTIYRKLAVTYTMIDKAQDRKSTIADDKAALAFSNAAHAAQLCVVEKDETDLLNFDVGYFNIAVNHGILGDSLKKIAPHAAIEHYNAAVEMFDKIPVARRDQQSKTLRDKWLRNTSLLHDTLDRMYYAETDESIDNIKTSLAHAKAALESMLKIKDKTATDIKLIETSCYNNLAVSYETLAEKLKAIQPQEAMNHYRTAMTLLQKISEPYQDAEIIAYKKSLQVKINKQATKIIPPARPIILTPKQILAATLFAPAANAPKKEAPVKVQLRKQRR